MAVIVKSRDSLLTTSSGYTNYRGILNLVIILLVLSNARAALENVIKYGILVDPLSWFLFLGESSKHWPSLLVVMGLGVHIMISLAIEKLIVLLFYSQHQPPPPPPPQSSKKTHNKPSSPSLSLTPPPPPPSPTIVALANLTLVGNLFACIALPPVVIYTNDTHPISTSAALLLVSIVFLKLVSYHMMNFWCRDLRRPESQQARTTRSFLRSYVPPAIDFGARNGKNDTNNTNSPQTPTPTPKTTTTTNETKDLRKRLTKNNDDNENNNNTSPPNLNALKNGSSEAKATNGHNGNSNLLNTNGHHPAGKQANGAHPHPSVPVEDIVSALADYPKNINFRNLCNFMLYPTLNYELEYAMTGRIRKRFLIKRILEFIILSQLDLALIQQWLVPTVNNSVVSFRQMQFSHMLERLLKLAIPNHVIWLIWFYMFFHSLLNIIAELTRFADREFYRDWWNSESVHYFWSNWNIPVHKWCARHLYVPLMSLGLSKLQASTAVFFVSAFFHEYLVSVPLKMFRMWAFTGMLIQLPLARFVSSYFNSYFANVCVWVSIIIGQPLCILMYYHDYYVISVVMKDQM